MAGFIARFPKGAYLVLVALLAALLLMLTGRPAGAAPDPSSDPGADPGAPAYYLALGDSLSVGVQPDARGRSRPTDQGYPDSLFTVSRLLLPELELVKLGCPTGETSTKMIGGGRCPYDNGSQLAEAVAFLEANRAATVLVTLDIGANDVIRCADRATGEIDMACTERALAEVADNLPRILADLRAAAGPGVPIIGMNYYDPFLATWLLGPTGRDFARRSVDVVVQLNQVLTTAYQAAGVPVADVQEIFLTTNFDAGLGLPGVVRIPVNVAAICVSTWMCALPPVGPNIHARSAGYGAMALAFLAALTKIPAEEGNTLTRRLSLLPPPARYSLPGGPSLPTEQPAATFELRS